MEPSSETNLIQQVGVWADRNFNDKRWAELGCVEEIGEAAHCVLKRFQGIRGYEKEPYFLEKFSDALADIIIYLCDWCYSHHAFFAFGRNHENIMQVTHEDERRIIVHLLQAAGNMLSYPLVFPNDHIPYGEIGQYNMVAQRMATGVECWAHIYGLDIRLLVSATWAQVGKRNWVADPQGAGGTPSQQQA
jgi:hypothetical protein